MTILIDYSSLATMHEQAVSVLWENLPPKLAFSYSPKPTLGVWVTWGYISHLKSKHPHTYYWNLNSRVSCSPRSQTTLKSDRPLPHRHLKYIWELKAYSPESDPIRWVLYQVELNQDICHLCCGAFLSLNYLREFSNLCLYITTSLLNESCRHHSLLK